MADMSLSNSTLSQFKSCPPGLNGTQCERATCDSPFVAPARRIAKKASDNKCTQCDDGFGGFNCNVCQTATACESIRAKLGIGKTGTTSSGGSGLAGAITRNETLTCDIQPKAVTTTYVDCKLDSPLLSAVLPGDFTYAGIKVSQPDNFDSTGLAAWPSGPATSYSVVFLNGVQQFRCQSSQCSSANITAAVDTTSKLGADNWKCDQLQCECLPGSTLCSGGGLLDLTAIINGLKGPLEMPCDYVPAGAPQGQGKCAFKSPDLTGFLGPEGLPLSQCSFGSCLAQADLDNSWAHDAEVLRTVAASKLSGAVIAGLIFLALAVAALISVLVLGWYLRRKASEKPRHEDNKAVGISWRRVNYHLGKAGPRWLPNFNAVKRRRPLDVEASSRGASAVGPGGFEVLKMESGGDHTVIAGLSTGDVPGHILKDIHGTCEPGTFTALLGPSGSGKTTLLDVLSGREKSGKLSGEVSFVDREGNVVSPSGDRRLVAFVDQEDHLPHLNTPREALAFACRLSNADNVPIVEQAAIVDAALSTLHLQHVADQRIGNSARRGLSGGEKRRVSIGMAMVARPKILLLDEPLSGLDATAAMLVIRSLRQLAAGPNGTTVIMTIHQPSSEIFYSADRVIVLSSGRVMYEGTPDHAIEWCEAHGHEVRPGFNVAELLLDMAYNPAMLQNTSLAAASSIAPESEAKASSRGSHRPLTEGDVEAPAPLDGTTQTKRQKPATVFYTQMSALLHRHYQEAVRDYWGPLAHIGGALILGLLVGGSFFQVSLSIGGFQNRVGSIYFLCILLSFTAMSGVTVMARARPLMLRERANAYYNPFAWMASFLAYDLLILRTIPTVILVETVYWMVGLKAKVDYHFLFLLMILSYSLTMALYNMALAVCIEDISICILLAGLFILFNIGFGGFLVNLNTMSKALSWLQWVSPLHYALESTASRELRGLMLIDSFGDGKIPIKTPVSVFAPKLFGFDDAYYRDLLWLTLGFLLPHALLLFAGAWWTMRERR